jgi:hypothetical protein
MRRGQSGFPHSELAALDAYGGASERISIDRPGPTACSKGRPPQQGNHMLRLIANNNTDGKAVATMSGTNPPPETINLKLLIWEDNGEILFTYGPSGDVTFKEDIEQKILDIELISRDNTPDFQQFWISHYTASTFKNIREIACYRRDRSPSNNKASDIPVAHSKKEKSEFTEKVTRIVMTLSMKKGDSFYVNLIAKDDKDPSRLISCDPQVENGTKT